MTILEVINSVISLKPNAYPPEQMVTWLNQVERKIKQEIIDTHCGGPNAPELPYTIEDNSDTVLYAPAPYDMLYQRWLEAQIDYANAEYSKYNNSISMFNTEYQTFADWYNRTYRPKRSGPIRF